MAPSDAPGSAVPPAAESPAQNGGAGEPGVPASPIPNPDPDAAVEADARRPASAPEITDDPGWYHPAGLALVAFAFALSALAPLYEMDLAQHLATGEWIVRHHAVPFTEPFAWTRAGQPYFAYSWLAQLVFYGLLRAGGPWALHLLEGVLVGASVASALWAGRHLRWRPATRLTVALLQLALLWGVANTLRPQQVLLIVIPLAWGLTARVRDRGAGARELLGLAAVGALAANTHVFFPLTAAPFAFYLFAEGGWRRWWPALGALVIGWLLTPYALAWPQIFGLNFGHSVLLRRPPSIKEFIPGFEYWWRQWGVMVAVAALLVAPWLVSDRLRPLRARIVTGVLWAAGLGMFAYAGRLVFVWWALAFLLLGVAVERAADVIAPLLRRPFDRAIVVGVATIVLVVCAPAPRPDLWAFEGDTVHRMLPRAGEQPALWLPGWLICHTHASAAGRIFTEFNYGTELNWRLPGYSPSIDGRTIFPDSDAQEFAFMLYGARTRHATTWTHADLALLDRTTWLVPTIARDPAWVLLAESGPGWRAGAALWARKQWWQRWGTPTRIPALNLMPGDPRGMCPAQGVFPKP